MSTEVTDASFQAEEPDAGKPVDQLGTTAGLPEPFPGTVGNSDHGAMPFNGGHTAVDRVNARMRNDTSGKGLGTSGVRGDLPRTVEGPQVVFQHRCKICNLSKLNQAVYNQLHEGVILNKMKLSTAMEFVNTAMGSVAGFQKLNMANLSVHFNKHAPVKDRVAYEISRQEISKATDIIPINHEVVETIEAKVGSDVDDFKDLANIREHLLDKLKIVESSIVQKDAAGNDTLNRFSMQIYTDLAKEIRACITDLSKMRQSERLMASVVKTLIHRMTFSIIPQLMDEYKLVVEEMVAKRVDPTVVKTIDERLRLRLAKIVMETARNAVTDVSREFKI